MALETQYVPLDFGGTLDQKTDKNLVVQGNFTTANNVVYTKTGSVSKRPGFAPMTTDEDGGASLPAVYHMAQGGDELLAYTQTHLYSTDAEDELWWNKGELPELTISRTGVSSAATAISMISSANYNQRITVYVYGDLQTTYISLSPFVTAEVTKNIYVTIVDDNTNVVQKNFKLNSADASQPQIVILGDFAYVTYNLTGSNNLTYRRIDLTDVEAGTISWSTEATLPSATDFSASAIYDLCAISATSLAVVYLTTTANTARISVYSNTPARTATNTFSTVVSAVTVTAKVFCLRGTVADDTLWVGYAGQSATDNITRGLSYQANLTLQTGQVNVFSSAITGTPDTSQTATVRLAVEPYDSGGIGVFVASTARTISAPRGRTWRQLVTRMTGGSAGVLTGTQAQVYSSMMMIARPFTVGNKVYVTLQDMVDNNIFLADVYAEETVTLTTNRVSFRPVVMFAPGQANARIRLYDTADAGKRSVADVIPLSATSFRMAVITNFADSNILNQVDVTAYEPVSTCFAAPSTVSTGGLISSYDGHKLAELSMCTRPILFSMTQGSGGNLADGTHRYRMCYEWTDADGQTFRSSPSDPLSVTFSGTGNKGEVSFYFTYNTLTTKQTTNGGLDVIRCILYTEYPLNSGVYRRLTPTNLDSVFDATSLGGFLNQIDVYGAGAFSDAGQYDGLLDDAEILYIANTVASELPPTSTMATLHQGRIWLSGTDTAGQLWPSNPLAANSPPVFSAALAVSISEGGPVTGLASLDDKLIVFKESDVFMIYGDGPNPMGIGGAFAVQKIPCDVGCIEPKSVVTTKDGVMFRSRNGIWMLSRALEAVFIGAPVEDTVNANANTRMALMHESQPWAIWFCDNGSTGVAIVYDCFHRKWCTWTLMSGAVIHAATMRNRQLVACTTTRPYTESLTSFLDDTSFVSMTIETAWLKLAGLMGYQRLKDILLLGENLTPHRLTFSVAHNYSESYTQTQQYASSVLGWDSEQFKVKIVEQKCSSARIKIVDTAPADTGLTGTGQSFSISGMGLYVGAKRKYFPLSSAQGN